MSSLSDSNKELHHDSYDARQLALVSPASGGWIQDKKKQGKKGIPKTQIDSGLGPSSL